jgi:glycerol-3-phosphate dehydrogenase
MSQRLGSSSLNAARRTRELGQLAAGQRVDVLVVGGGITGAGVALDAAARGLSVALIERGDLAQGTSRWSSKLVHGGLRYLAGGHPSIAWESARERAILLRTAPHLIAPLPFLSPLRAEQPAYVAGGTMAVLRAGDAMRRLAGTARTRLPNAQRIDALEARRLVPALDPSGLRGALMSWDGQLEDDAALVVGVARTAAAHGARILTYVRALSLDGDGAVARDERTGQDLRIRADHVVNAAGVWSGALAPGVKLRPSRGSHLLVEAERLGNPRAAFNVALEGSRSRFVFAVPRPDGLVLIGLTDVPVLGDVPDDATVTAEEEGGLLQTISRALEVPLTAADVVGRTAGMRPLVDGCSGDDVGRGRRRGGERGTADLSRRHALIEDPQSRVITIVGGKLTTYRRMAQDVVDAIAARPGVTTAACTTDRLALVGAQPRDTRMPGIDERLVRRYGAEAPLVTTTGRPEDHRRIAADVPVTPAELRFAVEHELALTPDDLLDRRTRVGLVPTRRAVALPAAQEALAGALEEVR